MVCFLTKKKKEIVAIRIVMATNVGKKERSILIFVKNTTNS